MTGRLRNLFPRLSGNGRTYSATGGNADTPSLVPPRPSTYPPGVGYVPGRGPHGPSGHDGEYAGKCYCGYRPEECDAYAEALRLYSAPALEYQDKATRQRDAFATEVEQLKACLAEVEEQRDAMARDLIVLAHRRNDLRRMLAASPEQAYGNCLALSDRNEELRRDLNDLEKRYAELQRERASCRC